MPKSPSSTNFRGFPRLIIARPTPSARRLDTKRLSSVAGVSEPAGRGRKVSRDDVARRAGTSTAVVSYVLNDGPRRVAPVARALAARRTDALGLVVSDISNPFVGDLARAIETAAYEHGLTVLLANADV